MVSNGLPPLETDAGYGCYLWPCASELAKFIFNFREWFRGKNVLELGCGTGLPGIMAAIHCGAAQVIFTDKTNHKEALECCRQNVARNIKNVFGIESTTQDAIGCERSHTGDIISSNQDCALELMDKVEVAKSGHQLFGSPNVSSDFNQGGQTRSANKRLSMTDGSRNCKSRRIRHPITAITAYSDSSGESENLEPSPGEKDNELRHCSNGGVVQSLETAVKITAITPYPDSCEESECSMTDKSTGVTGLPVEQTLPCHATRQHLTTTSARCHIGQNNAYPPSHSWDQAVGTITSAVGRSGPPIVRFEPLSWGVVTPFMVTELAGTLDVILISDGFYDPSVFDDLCFTISFLLSTNRSAKVFCSYQVRNIFWTIEDILPKYDLKATIIDPKNYSPSVIDVHVKTVHEQPSTVVNMGSCPVPGDAANPAHDSDDDGCHDTEQHIPHGHRTSGVVNNDRQNLAARLEDSAVPCVTRASSIERFHLLADSKLLSQTKNGVSGIVGADAKNYKSAAYSPTANDESHDTGGMSTKSADSDREYDNTDGGIRPDILLFEITYQPSR